MSTDETPPRPIFSQPLSGKEGVGGLVGDNNGARVTDSYARGPATGGSSVGGLVGWGGSVTRCYSTGVVSGTGYVGGLVGSGWVVQSVWDAATSGLSASAYGVGLTTAEMMDPYVLGLNGFANDPNWVLDAGRDYPRLAWEGMAGQIIPEPTIDWLEGRGTAEEPYRINAADQLILVSKASILWQRHLLLEADIDLDPDLPGRKVFNQALINSFNGVFDGNDHMISHLTIEGKDFVGLFGILDSGAEVRNLGLLDVSVTSSGYYVGGLVGWNSWGTVVTQCYSTGLVKGSDYVGGLMGFNHGPVTHCYSAAVVDGNNYVGGLVGRNDTTVIQCYSNGAVDGNDAIGGLVGWNFGSEYSTNNGYVIQCYSTGAVIGKSRVGGLVGRNDYGTVTNCYSTGTVIGTEPVGGLVGSGWAESCFWDTQTSGQDTSTGGTGKTTAEMQTAATFLWAGWYPCGEAAIWTIDEGRDYPRLWWENRPGQPIEPIPLPEFMAGTGMADDPYLIYTAEELNRIGLRLCEWDKHFKLMADIDLSSLPGAGFNIIGSMYVPFTGVFDGNGHAISGLTLTGTSCLGLFGYLSGEVIDVGMVDVNVAGGTCVGGLVGRSKGHVTRCYSTGTVSGAELVGGLLGYNEGGTATNCYSTAVVSGSAWVGGLLGMNGVLSTVRPRDIIARGKVSHCYSAGSVSSQGEVGGLAGTNSGDVTDSFWDTQTSGQVASAGGTGKATAEMQKARTFLDAGWDFVGETANGTQDLWWIDEGKDYPRLWWER